MLSQGLLLHFIPWKECFPFFWKQWNTVLWCTLCQLSSLNQKHGPWVECVGTTGQPGRPSLHHSLRFMYFPKGMQRSSRASYGFLFCMCSNDGGKIQWRKKYHLWIVIVCTWKGNESLLHWCAATVTSTPGGGLMKAC